MRGKWIKLILVVSLAANCAFIASLTYKKYFYKSSKPERRPHFKESSLSDDQKQKIRAIVKKFRVDLIKYKEDIIEKRINIIDQLGDPEFDPETINSLTDELNVLENQLNVVFIDTLIQTINHLSAEQRLNFLLRISKNWFFLNKPRPENLRRKNE
jgi:Spy/CpxP family protein refolding chaperone